MSTLPSSDRLKSMAQIARRFLKEKCGLEISHSHSLEMIAQQFGVKDWNTAAALASIEPPTPIRPARHPEFRQALKDDFLVYAERPLFDGHVEIFGGLGIRIESDVKRVAIILPREKGLSGVAAEIFTNKNSYQVRKKEFSEQFELKLQT